MYQESGIRSCENIEPTFLLLLKLAEAESRLGQGSRLGKRHRAAAGAGGDMPYPLKTAHFTTASTTQSDRR